MICYATYIISEFAEIWKRRSNRDNSEKIPKNSYSINHKIVKRLKSKLRL